MSDHLHEWADLIFGFKQKGETSKLLSIFFFFFWLQLKGYSFSALELKLDQEVVLCKGDIQKTVCTIKRALGPKNYKESLRGVQEQSPNIKVKHQSPNSK